MKRTLDDNWTFYHGGENPFWGVNGNGISVNLPHDYSIMQKRKANSLTGASNAFFKGGLGCYKKVLFIPEKWRGKQVSLEFEGVYMNCTVHINGQLLTRHPYGYTSFFCDPTPYMEYGRDNLISVNVNNGAVPNTRWYSGSGIYRHVWLEVCDKVHIAHWGIYVTTPVVDQKHSTVEVKTTVENIGNCDGDVKLRSTLVDAGGSEVAFVETEVDAKTGCKSSVGQTFNVLPAQLWSVDNPHLYTLNSQILKNGMITDETQTTVGIRSLSFTPKLGFQLNGKTIKLKGGCVHHDCGLLGAAAYDRAEERKVELLKANGYNAVRCAHNPPSPAFLDACDKLGMLVIDEAFDCWHEAKNSNDYGVYFDKYWEEDLSSMVLRDRNHPSIIMWSTGNEILERDGHSMGATLAKKLADFVRDLDENRAITNALCPIPGNNDKTDESNLAQSGDQWGKLTKEFAAPLDVVGYNYLRHRYEHDGIKFPERIICGTETYPIEAYEYWREVQRFPYVIGDFVWTALDYLGEAGLGRTWYDQKGGFLGDYPWLTAHCGDIDICGFKRPQSYYRDCVWGISKSPYIAVHTPEHYGEVAGQTRWSWPDVISSWDWPEFIGKPILVDIYCADDEVELILNGRSLGRKPSGEPATYKASFETVYEPGVLVAIGYKNGAEASRAVLKTAGSPAAILLSPDRNVIDAKPGDLSYITVEIVDKEQNLIHNAGNTIFFTIRGAGSLAGIGSSDPRSEEPFVGNQCKAYEGRAMAVVRSNGEPGDLFLTASADGLPPASVTLKSVALKQSF